MENRLEIKFFGFYKISQNSFILRFANEGYPLKVKKHKAKI